MLTLSVTVANSVADYITVLERAHADLQITTVVLAAVVVLLLAVKQKALA